jgi:hypothetical protein
VAGLEPWSSSVVVIAGAAGACSHRRFDPKPVTVRRLVAPAAFGSPAGLASIDASRTE